MSTVQAPELSAYQDQPQQMRAGTPGKSGLLEMEFERRAGRTILAGLRHRAPLLVQRALYCDEQMPGLPCVYMITTSGCVLQGDRLDVAVRLGPRAIAHVTTQAATKVHEMDANFAAQSQRLWLAEQAYLEFLPGPAILHRHSRFVSVTAATVAADATLLYAETTVAGRKYYGAGELFEYDLYSAALSATRPDGSRLFTDKLVSEPARQEPRDAGVMGRFDVLASVIVITQAHNADRILEQTAAGVDPDTGCLSGASRLPAEAGLSYKVLGTETAAVKLMVRKFWSLVRREIAGSAIPGPRTWG